MPANMSYVDRVTSAREPVCTDILLSGNGVLALDNLIVSHSRQLSFAPFVLSNQYPCKSVIAESNYHNPGADACQGNIYAGVFAAGVQGLRAQVNNLKYCNGDFPQRRCAVVQTGNRPYAISSIDPSTIQLNTGWSFKFANASKVTALKSDDADALPTTPPTGGDLACSLNGVLDAASSACKCRSAWTGVNCTKLVLQPATKAFQMPGMVAWGAAPIQDPVTKQWHMFVAVYKGTLGDWNPRSHIVHTISSRGADGPYTLADTVLGRYHCSPAVLRRKLPDGSWGYVLYASGSEWNSSSSDPPARYGNMSRVGAGTLVIATSTSLQGPWTSQQLPMAFGGLGAAGNPSVITLPEGKFAMIGDSHSSNGGAFVSSSVAGPFIPTNPTCKGLPLTCGSCADGGSWVFTQNPHPDRYYQEDHRVYTDAAGYFHVFCHAMSLEGDSSSCHACDSGPGCHEPLLNNTHGGRRHARTEREHAHRSASHPRDHAGGHLFSKSIDGPWVASSVPPYTTEIRWASGETTIGARRERPYVVQDPVTGDPLWLFNGIDLGNGTLPFVMVQKVGGVTPPSGGICNYTEHLNVSFHGGPGRQWNANNIACVDGEGLAACRARCDDDEQCANFALYVRGPSNDRCCTKTDNGEPKGWSEGVSYTKISSSLCPFVPSKPAGPPMPVPPAPPSAPVDVSVIFRGNSSFPYNKGAMVQALPGGKLMVATQAGINEGSPDMRIIYALSKDNGRTWPDYWLDAVPEKSSAGPRWPQWQPVLFYDSSNTTLWLFWSEGPGSNPNLLYCSTTTAASGFAQWSPQRLILNATTETARRKLLWPVGRVVISPAADGAWLLPCDWGCGFKGASTGTFLARSMDAGLT